MKCRDIGWSSGINRSPMPADLDRLHALDPDRPACPGDLRQPLGHAAKKIAWRPAERAEGAAAVVIEHADLPQFVGQALHHVLALIEPQELAGTGKAGLVLRRNFHRVK